MPLQLQAATVLQEYLDTPRDWSPDAYLFQGPRTGTRLSKTAGCRAIKSVFVAAGIQGAPGELGCHSLRKTFARLVYEVLEHDLVRTSYALRHASVGTTVKYLSFREAEVDAAILAIYWGDLGIIEIEQGGQKAHYAICEPHPSKIATAGAWK